MNWTFAFQLGTAIIASLGGGGAIVFGLSNYLGKLWADRVLEQERHKYAQLLQTAKSELDKAMNRYQVELDSLKLIHTLRTTEEFSQLGKLWQHMAILQDAFKGTAQLGLSILPADEDSRKKYLELLRSSYEEVLWKARQFFLEQKLFIPANIADCAESTLKASITEKNLYAVFHDHYDPGVRSQYSRDLPKLVNEFDSGMEALEKLMREHIHGQKLILGTAVS
jgi:hypothetical protein